MNELKSILEKLNGAAILTHVADNKMVYTVLIILSLAVGSYIGYAPDGILAWLGLK